MEQVFLHETHPWLMKIFIKSLCSENISSVSFHQLIGSLNGRISSWDSLLCYFSWYSQKHIPLGSQFSLPWVYPLIYCVTKQNDVFSVMTCGIVYNNKWLKITPSPLEKLWYICEIKVLCIYTKKSRSLYTYREWFLSYANRWKQAEGQYVW